MPERIRLTQTIDGVVQTVIQLDVPSGHIMSPEGTLRTDNKAEGIKIFCKKAREYIDSLEHQVSD